MKKGTAYEMRGCAECSTYFYFFYHFTNLFDEFKMLNHIEMLHQKPEGTLMN